MKCMGKHCATCQGTPHVIEGNKFYCSHHAPLQKPVKAYYQLRPLTCINGTFKPIEYYHQKNVLLFASRKTFTATDLKTILQLDKPICIIGDMDNEAKAICCQYPNVTYLPSEDRILDDLFAFGVPCAEWQENSLPYTLPELTFKACGDYNSEFIFKFKTEPAYNHNMELTKSIFLFIFAITSFYLISRLPFILGMLWLLERITNFPEK